ncbi:MAG: thiamine-phosphate kinase [Bacillaceae bacterium]|nr:thiamine-phosphate kinase [Bacillaceae bacterium]
MKRKSGSERLDEFGLIRFLTERQPDNRSPSGVTIGPGDDAAVVKVTDGMELVVSCDTMVEHVHFKKETLSCEDIGFKALAANISDIAAMGGIPRFFLVSLGVSADWSDDQLKAIYNGMYELADSHRMTLIGGDTVSAGQLVLTITVLGEVEKGKALRRSDARPGDRVFVTGSLGGASAGLDFLLKNGKDQVVQKMSRLVEAHQRPVPQVKAGRLLNQAGFVHALNDISDGLASEAWEIAESSDVRIVLDPGNIPVFPGVEAYAREQNMDYMDWIWYGGEEFQLIGTVPATQEKQLKSLFDQNGLPIYFIGRVKSGETAVVLAGTGKDEHPLPRKGYNHFRG